MHFVTIQRRRAGHPIWDGQHHDCLPEQNSVDHHEHHVACSLMASEFIRHVDSLTPA